MNISSFRLMKMILGGGKLLDEKQQELFSETMFMVLSGAARADLNIEPVEVDRIRDILKRKLDREFTSQEIQLAGETELYDTAPIQKYVSRASRVLPIEQRQEILRAMIEVFLSDGRMGVLEKDYFDSIVEALHLKPSEMLQL
ncbi:MAG: hypothetical protein HKO71_00075 [Pseudomonadales bacterium]|nr:TerB family tellurite resistance protein [Gammaproteobacteria bacterium]NNL56120.1 hypothetical protein [Pseudomonadales bacterium]